MTRKINNYNKSRDSQYSYNQKINIQPVFWGSSYGGHFFQVSDSDWIDPSDKITVYYQMGSSFSFIVPLNLTISSILFDALDSSLLPTENCLKENYRCCTINGNNTVINLLNPNPASNWDIQTSQTEEWKVTYGFSLFQFGYSDLLSSIDGVGSLNILNWEFQNYFYDFTSFIGLIKGHGKIFINNTIFDKFSNWGSIIRDTRELPSLDYTGTGTTNSQILITNRNSFFTINQLQNKYLITPSYPWTNSSWSSIQISYSTFTNFNFYKTGGFTYHKVDKNSSMKYQGIILNLLNFYGNIVLNNNIYSGLVFKYNNWEEVYNSPEYQTNSFSIFGSPSVLQVKTLIYLNAKSDSIEIYNNIFKNWNSLQGLIFIERASNSNSAILIHNNSFFQNSAIFGSNVLKINLFTDISYTTNFISNDTMIWSGVQISANLFTKNVGCFNTTGAIQAFWYSDSMDSENYSNNNLEYPLPMINIPSQNLSKKNILNFSASKTKSMPSSTLTMDTNKFIFYNNSYIENYIGAQTSIVEIRGIRSIELINDIYLDNLGQFKESLNKYGSIKSQGENNQIDNYVPGAWSLYSYYGNEGLNNTIQELVDLDKQQNFYPQSPLLIDGVFKINITGVIFDNNAFQELDQILVVNNFPSNAITITRSQGVWYLNSITIRNLMGLDPNKLKDTLSKNSFNLLSNNPTQRDKNGVPLNSATFPNFIIDYGIKNQLFKFVNPQTTTGNNFQNYFDLIVIDGLKCNNITQFDPIKETALILDIGDDWDNLTITNFEISNVDLIEGQTSMFALRNYGPLMIKNGIIFKLNFNAYNYDKVNYTYVGDNGGSFSFYSIPVYNKSVSLNYSIDNVTFDSIYGLKGGAVFFSTKDNGADFQSNVIMLSNLTIK